MIELLLSGSRITVFLGQKKKIQITTNTLRAFQLLEAIIFSASGQIHFGLKFFQHRLENYFGR